MADIWSTSVGSHGSTVTVKEREFGGTLYLQWYEDRKTRKRSLGYRLRTAKGKIIQKRKKKAIKEAEEHQAKLLGEAPVDEPVEDLTLQRAFELFLRVSDGHYAAETRDYHDVRRFAERIEGVLGSETLWSDLAEGSPARRLWRELAQQHIDHGIGGHRSTERILVTLFLLGDWLDEHHNAPSLRRPKRWKKTLKHEWQLITGREPQVNKPRYTEGEIARLDANQHRLDPRAHLLFDLSFGQRVGQHLRLWRSNINLERTPDQPWGSINVEGQGNKPAGLMHLTESQYRHLKSALSDGYLSDCEIRFQRGELEDYVLFPGGRLVREKANPRSTRKPSTSSWARAQFRELEELAGITHQHGRGWNGIRRKAADLAENVTDDARVLRKEGSWTNDETRVKYQEEESPDILRAAAEVRAQIRGELAATSPDDGASSSSSETDEAQETDLDVGALLELLRDRKAKGRDPADLLHAALALLSEEEDS